MRDYRQLLFSRLLLAVSATLLFMPVLTTPKTVMADTKISSVQPPSTVITSCGTTISTPGTYILTSYISGCNADGVDIASSDVTLDMQNFGFLSACINGCGNQVGIKVSDSTGGPIKNVNILRGLVEDFVNGVVLVGVQNSQFTGLAVDFATNCLVLNSDSKGDHSQQDLFTQNSFSQCTAWSIEGNSIYDSVFIGNICGGPNVPSGIGMQILNGSGNTISGNSFISFSTGVELGGTGSTGVAGNRVIGNRMGVNSTGILVGTGASGNTFSGNYATLNTVLDIDEGNSGCATDHWIRNVFNIANQSCVH